MTGREQQIAPFGEPTDFTCPACHGVLRMLPRLPLPTYRCRTGHQFTIDSLIPAMEDDVEENLWGSLRVLEEAVDAETKLAETLRTRGEEEFAQEAERRVARHRRQMQSVRAAIESD